MKAFTKKHENLIHFSNVFNIKDSLKKKGCKFGAVNNDNLQGWTFTINKTNTLGRLREIKALGVDFDNIEYSILPALAPMFISALTSFLVDRSVINENFSGYFLMDLNANLDCLQQKSYDNLTLVLSNIRRDLKDELEYCNEKQVDLITNILNLITI